MISSESLAGVRMDFGGFPTSIEALARIVDASDRRREAAKKRLSATRATYGTKDQFRGLLDAFHGETAFALDQPAATALDRAWRELLASPETMVEADGQAYHKRQPRVLRELAARRLFGALRSPAPGVDGVEVSPDEVLVCPYTSTILLEEALASIAAPGAVLLAPEGFYKNNALHIAKYGLAVQTIQVAAATGFRLEPQKLIAAAAQARQSGRPCGILLTMPGNPVIVDYAPAELRDLARAIAATDLPVICDAAFDQCQAGYVPLAALTVELGGVTRRLYDQVLTVGGNSKAFSAFGPCKLGAACTGNAAWRSRLATRLTHAFQRETTHLVRAVLENTRDEYFAENRDVMARQQLRSRQLVESINAQSGRPAIRPFPQNLHGMFLNLELDPELARLAGLASSLELEDMLLLAQGVDTACFARMGSPLLAVRLNILAPRKQGVKDPRHVEELFDRIARFASDIRQGLTYEAVKSRHGLGDMGKTLKNSA